MTYISELEKETYVPNVVIRFRSTYFCIRQPDSGLVITAPYQGIVKVLNLVPTAIDPNNATTTVNTNSFSLVDRDEVVTQLFSANDKIFQGDLVEIWIGRSGVSMPFSDYLKIADTYTTKISKQDASYNFQTREAKDRLSNGAFTDQAKLGVDILSGTTVITLQDASNMPSSGLFKLDDEFISYTGIIGNDLQACIRGEQSSVPVAHSLGSDVYVAEVIQANPITLLLQLLISSGGGGTYDVLNDGAAISETLIDITEFEQVRTEYFSADTYKFILYNLDSLKKFLENEILLPLNIRMRTNNNGKIGLAVLDRPTFNLDAPDLTHSNIVSVPTYEVDENKVYNRLKIEWEYSDTTQKYANISQYSDANSIAEFGDKSPVTLKFKGIKSSLSGQTICDKIAEIFFLRFAYPKPLVTFKTFMSASVWELGEKAYVETSLLPTVDGDLNFGDSLEIISRAINPSGDVNFKLSFNAFTGLRACFLAPSDTIVSVIDQKTITVGAGRGENYRKYWQMKLYDNLTRDVADTQINEIDTVVGDTITFLEDWNLTLLTTHRIMFADYDDVDEQQRRFCFISDDGNNFSDGKPAFVLSF